MSAHHDVDAARLAGVDASKTTAAGSPDCLRDHGHVVALAPDACSCSRAAARKVSPAASSTDLPCCCIVLGELADGGGLARAVDAGDHHHERLARPSIERLFQRRSSSVSSARSAVLSRRPPRYACAGLIPQVGNEPFGGGNAAIAGSSAVSRSSNRASSTLTPTKIVLRLGPRPGEAAAQAGEPSLPAGA